MKTKDPERDARGLVCYWLEAGSLIRSALANPPESIVHAHQNSLNIGLGGEDIVSAKNSTAGKARVALKAQIIVFEEHGPVRHELPFHATTSRPAGATGLRARNLTEIVDKLCLRMRPRRTALRVEQQVRLGEIAYATRQNVEPLHFGLESGIAKGRIKEERINVPGVTDARPVKQVAKANHPPTGKLIIAANLTAASKATIAARDFYTRKIVRHAHIRPGPTDIAADVAAGPNIGRRRRWWWRPRRCLTRQIRSQGGSDGEGGECHG